MMRPRKIMRRRTITCAAVVGWPERRREQERLGPSAETVDPIEQVKQLNELREQGILTEEEFTQEKRKLLDL